MGLRVYCRGSLRVSLSGSARILEGVPQGLSVFSGLGSAVELGGLGV